jgi:hypothetical protein
MICFDYKDIEDKKFYKFDINIMNSKEHLLSTQKNGVL